MKPLDSNERFVLESLGRLKTGTRLTMNPEITQVILRANALIEEYERITPEEGRRVWAAAFTDALRDRKLSLADANELRSAKEHADTALSLFQERFGVCDGL